MNEGGDGRPRPDGRGDAVSGPSWHPLARVLFYCGTLLLILNLVSMVVLVGLLALRGEGADLVAALERLRDSPDAAMLLAVYPVVGPVTWFFTAFFRRQFDRRGFSALGVSRVHLKRGFLLGSLAGLLAPGLIVVAGLAVGAYSLSGGNPAEAFTPEVTSRAGWREFGAFLLLGAGFVLQSSSEELVVRGYVQRNMVEWKGASRNLVWILIVPSAIFSLFHGFNPSYGAIPAVNTVLIGVLLGAIVLGSGHIWSVCGIHSGWNFGVACVWSLPLSGLSTPHLLPIEVVDAGAAAQWVFGGGYGPEGGLAVTVLTVLGIVWALPRAMRAWEVDGWGVDRDQLADSTPL